MQSSAVLAVLLFLTGCGVGARDARLAGLDLNDRGVLTTLGQGFSERERGALATYALLHWPNSNAYCGDAAFKDQRRPATVGEAIDLTLAFEARLEAKRSAERRATSVYEERALEERRLVDEFDQLTLDRDKLRTSRIPQAEKTRRLAKVDYRLDANRRLRGALPFEQVAQE